MEECQRCERIIRQAPLMIFIKGSPSRPQCGFTRQLLTLLDQHHLKYGSFDILGDENVRAAMKLYSDWPTYPQVYWKGEFLGGLDIVRELFEAGEFPAPS